ncbi:hypothetical protein PM082_004092 [Marasmius tenuissimus]|nr:hypothetical protein PM082_004092 [Marasmius tenuissimus]
MDISSPLRVYFIEYADPLLYGCLMGIGCFGVCVAQTWTYIKLNDDTRVLQAMVALLFCLVTATTVLNGQIIRFYLLENFGNYLAMTSINGSVSTLILLNYIVTFISDLCFASRIRRLQRVHWSLIGLIVLATVATLVSGAVLLDQILLDPLVFTLHNAKYKINIPLNNSMAATSQALITFCLWYSFKAHMDEASNTPQPVFQRLSFTVTIRGTLLTSSHLVFVILYLARPDQIWWIPLNQAHAALHYMTAIATLNIRAIASSRIREDPEAAKEYRRDSAIDPFLLVTPRNPAGDYSFLHYIHDIRRPAPVLDLHPVDSMRSERATGMSGDPTSRRGDGTMNIRMEWRPYQDESGVISPPENNESSSRPPPLLPNRLNEGVSTSSSGPVPSKGKEREIDGPRKRSNVGDIHPQLIRQLPKVPAEQ